MPTIAWISVCCSGDNNRKGLLAGCSSWVVVGKKVVRAKLFDHLFDVARHGNGDRVGLEGDVHSKIGVTSGFNCDLVVVRSQSLYEMISIILSSIANAEIIDNKARNDVTSFVFEKTGILTL